ncbi:MAG: hypothetical protein QXW47_05385 [Candidatus Jordarchaeales archaeon]|nr:hypothetical protein [Candidatus Jordarchaeia archaeon]
MSDRMENILYQFKSLSLKLDESLKVMERNFELLSRLMERVEQSIRELNATFENLARTIREQENLFADQVETLLNSFNFEVRGFRDAVKLETFNETKELLDSLLETVQSEINPQRIKPMMNELVQASLKILSRAGGAK